MHISLHSVSDPGAGGGPSSAVAMHVPELGFCGVADAMVGASLLDRDLGAAASQLALDTLRSHLDKGREQLLEYAADPTPESQNEILEAMRTGFSLASREVNALARRRNLDIAVTLDAVLVLGRECLVGHVGDGRVFLVRKGLVHTLTQDHLEGDPEERLEAAGKRPRLSRCLGPAPQVRAEALALQLSGGDRILVTSPWLHRGLNDLNTREVIDDPQPDGVTARLLGTARGTGLRQDMGVALVSYGSDEGGDASNGRQATLARIPLFTYCTERELRAIAGVTRPVNYRAGTVLFREGDMAQGLYLVVQGKLAVLKDGRKITNLSVGDNFGEMSMLDEPQRSATVKAIEDSELLLITRDAFFSLLKRDPTLAVKVLWNMLLRLSSALRATSEALARTASPTDRPF